MVQTETSRAGRQKPVKKAEVILEGAMQEFLAHGYAATSMDRIAAAAGVSKATVYSHFQDKEGLFTTLIQRLAQERYRTIFDPQHPQSLQGEPRIVLRRLATEILDNSIEDQQFHDFMRIIVGESGRFPQLARTYVQNLAKPVIEILGQYLASHSELKLPDPEAAVRVFIGTLVYCVIFQELLHGKKILPMERERLIETLIHLIVPENL
ncbi:MAG: TetR/AcrR family transcriptional regulator [Symploca sp. SIO1C4]|uniref:TetR/AcrR family transcriptional regulator n=1 Tax=Symploca sp. SIO1C4 TaxID=2607765 RepID=A0A6B3NCT1_9CYAN|nr:TetR/AcrR family transcriptional regulator [Symploca sp. SIO1C4]NET07082.1 TetR/AcrR family transcriptional regulator [Symploca sp. SIO2B6]